MPQCGKCDKNDAMKRCGACRTVRYCSRECQRTHWPIHKPTCDANQAANIRQPLLPALYPGPPAWLDDPSPIIDSINIPHLLFGRQRALKSATAFRQRRELLQRTRHLDSLYVDKATTLLSLAEHRQLFASAGLELKVDKDDKTLLSRADCLLFGLLDGRIAAAATHRQCCNCEAITEKECVCGESFCSVECQRAKWMVHCERCREVEDEHQLAMWLNELYWRSRLG